MEKHLVPGDPILIENIVNYLKAKGIFDEFRHECLADVDTKSSCQNLSQRVDGYTTKFLLGEKWHSDLNKNELRNKLRRHIDESGMLAGGADHVVEQVINPKINQLFLPRIIEVVHQYLSEENEKLNRKKESSMDNVNFEKQAAENIDGANKNKSNKVDPIADILSFSYSKPKPNPTQNVQSKVTDLTKAERKKDENVPQAKLSDVLPKIEKKKEEPIFPAKISEAILKSKKEEFNSDVMQSTEKDKEESLTVKMEPIESITEPSPAAVLQTKPQSETKELIKIKKEVKTEEIDSSSDTLKKTQREDVKSEKKKIELEKKKEDSEKKKDDSKSSSDLSSHSEEGGQSKVVSSVPKSASVVKIKSEAEKSKKLKPHGSSKTSSDSQKSKTKDSDKSSNKHSDKLKLSSKVSKTSTKDHSAPHKSSGTSKSYKSDKTEDSNKSKTKDGHSKLSSSKLSSIKKEGSSVKSRPSFDKTKTSKSSDLKPKIQTHIEAFEKASKSNLQYSSYDSSQGSDQDKSSTLSSQHKEKHKHFSKHLKKESNNKKSSEKEKTPDKKRFQSDSDSGTPVKHKHTKHASEKEKKKSLIIHESAKISSRSNSFGSTSSVSDSPSSSKETSASASEETSDNSLKSSEAKKKQGIKDKERCKQTEDFPPPPPPPPTSGISAPGSSSAEISSMDETQSSQESESDSKLSEDESSSESDVENLYSSNSLKNSILETRIKTPEILNDVFDVFLYSSSSSEFEGYSSTPEQEQETIKQIDVDVSSVHTSDLSSFDDLLSESECSNSDIEEDRPTRRLTIKEAEKYLQEKARQRRLEREKNMLPLKSSLDDKKSNHSPQICTSVLFSEDETSAIPEPKRESRRERKLNPKYASNEYASIFNSKKTSFITKQVNPNEDKSENVSPTFSESDINLQKDISLPKRRISMGNLEANQLPNKDVKNTSSAAATLQSFEFSDNTKRKLSFESTEECSWTSENKTYPNSHERNHNMILEGVDSHCSIALKIKKSLIKNDNEINKEPRPQGLKRKLDRIEKDSSKKLCRRNSDNSSSSESVPNENNPFNIKTNNPSSVFNMEPKNKDFFHKQKISNNGVLKMEHVKKKSHSKPNHVIEKQSSE